MALLNQDTRVAPNWLNKLVKVMEADRKIAAVQPTILLWPEQNKINSIGNEIHFLGFGFAKGNQQLALSNNQSIQQPVTYCSGAACLLRVSALQKVGLFDEKLFLYQEDLDLGWRFLLAGYQNYLAPQSVVYHQYQYSQSKYKYYYLERNRHWVNLKNYSWWTLLIITPAMIIMELGMWVFAIKNNWWWEKLKGYGSLLVNLPYIFRERNRVQKLRQVKDKQIVKKFVGKIWYQEISNSLLNYVGNPLLNLYWRIVKRLI